MSRALWLALLLSTSAGCYPWVGSSEHEANNPPIDISGNCLPEDQQIWYRDGDGDGVGDEYQTKQDCTQPAGFVAESELWDCDDVDPLVYPGRPEIPYDGVDQDCLDGDLCDVDSDGLPFWMGCEPTNAGLVDCDDSNALIGELWFYTDGDGDGFGDGGETLCSQGAVQVGDDTDCDDSSDAVYPGAPDPYGDGIDSNCDGADGVDSDGDGEPPIGVGGLDCDDGDPSIHPLAPDFVDNGIDNNCDGVPGLDADADGHASEATNGADCDDADPLVFPGAAEVCDNIDNDCDQGVDLPLPADADLYFVDSDNDSFGDPDPLLAINACGLPPGFVADNTDCDDADPQSYPGAPGDTSDGTDNNCDGIPGIDGDQDGFASEQSGGADCNDVNPQVFPGAVDTPYDGVDQDCDGTDLCDVDGDGVLAEAALCGGSDCDDNDPAILDDWYYPDLDGDGSGAQGVAGARCLPLDPSDVLNDDDCDDQDDLIGPNQPDFTANGVDNNCDGLPGEDLDQDGQASLLSGGLDCDDSDPLTYGGAPDFVGNNTDNDCDGHDGVDSDGDGDASTASGGGDCDEADPDQFFGALEFCNGEDTDCDGQVDAPAAIDATTWYPDDDGDGFGRDADAFDACLATLGSVNIGGDCDDIDPDAFPGAPDFADGSDNNCDGSPGVDNDGDQSASVGSGGDDCDDTDPSTYPGAVETPYDGVDQDCDGADHCDVDQDGILESGILGVGLCAGTDCDDTDPLLADPYYTDGDGDGYGDELDNTGSCTPQGGDAPNNLDCDDNDPGINPTAIDNVIDGIDTDCDGAPGVDSDRDGYASFASGGDDCNDTNTSFYPGAIDTVGDLFDQNCDGVDGIDADADGHASEGSGGGDCDDNDPFLHPTGLDTLFNDQDCDGLVRQGDTPNTLITAVPGKPFEHAARSVAGGDFDGDGFSDLLIAGSEGLEGLHIFYGSAEGISSSNLGVSNTHLLPGAIPPTLVRAGGDHNNDGYDDFIVVISSWSYLFDGAPGRLPSSAIGASSGPHIGLSGPDHSVSISGDVNGDAYDDLLVSTPISSRIDLLLGPIPDGTSYAWADYAARYYAPAGSISGGSIDLVDDLDGDGLSEMLVGAEQDDGGGVSAGAAYLVLGTAAPADLLLEAADAKWTGAPLDEGGKFVLDASDLDGDGYSDVAIATNTDVLLFNGHSGPWSSAPLNTAPTTLGQWQAAFQPADSTPIVAVGDLDSDGFDDLAIASEAEVVYILLGRAGGFPSGNIPDLADAALDGSGQWGPSMISLAAAGDTNGDGWDDLLIGAPEHSSVDPESGAAFLFLGSSL